MKWTSVNDKLPPKYPGEIVLACTDAPNGSYPKIVIAIYDHAAQQWGFINKWMVHSLYADDYKITHWMPLPREPELEGNK